MESFGTDEGIRRAEDPVEGRPVVPTTPVFVEPTQTVPAAGPPAHRHKD